MKILKIGNLITIFKGKKVESFSQIQNEKSLRFIQIDDLRNDESLKYTSSKGILVKPEDIIIAWDGANAGTIGYGLSGIIGSTLAKLELQTGDVLPEYLGLFLKSQSKYLRERTTGATIPHIGKQALINIEIQIPSLTEQKRIVKLLNQADALRQKRKEAIRLLDEYLKSVFLDMFGDPIINNKGWKMVNLGSLLKNIDSGWSPKCLDKKASANKWGVLKLSAVTGCNYIEDQNKELPDTFEPKTNIEVKDCDLLFSRKNTYELVGASAFIFNTRPKLMLSDLIFRLNIQDTSVIKTEFLWKLLVHPGIRKNIQSLAGGAAGSMPNISKEKLRNVALPVPPIDLQNKFADIVLQTEKLKQKMLGQSVELDNQFRALMQRAFKV